MNIDRNTYRFNLKRLLFESMKTIMKTTQCIPTELNYLSKTSTI